MLEQSLNPKTTLDLSSHAFVLKTLQQICRLLISSDSFLREEATPFNYAGLAACAESRSSCRFLAHAASDHLNENLRAIDVQATPAGSS